jgi:glutamate dehydrogenase (NADP+)
MKLIEKGAIVLTMSDSKGYIYEKEGITAKQLEQVGNPAAGCWPEGGLNHLV